MLPFGKCIECLIMECCKLEIRQVFPTHGLACLGSCSSGSYSCVIRRREIGAASLSQGVGKNNNFFNVDGDSWSQEYCRARGEIH